MTRTYVEPASVEEALAALGEGVDVVAGGTDVVVAARGGRRPLGSPLVAIHRIPGLGGIEEREDGSLRLGALVTHRELETDALVRERLTALADAAALVGSPATRSAGTLGGNLANASPAMESGSPLLCFDARVELASQGSVRSLPLAEFLRGPGQTARAAGELVTAVEVPPPPAGRVGSAYVRLEYRQAMEIAIVGAAALLALDDAGRIVEGRLALTAVAPVCLRCEAAERLLAGGDLASLAAAADAAVEECAPIDDVRAPAEYRRAMVSVIARRALESAYARAEGGPR